MNRTAIVIGGGVGGLSAAIHLAARGVRVTLLEKNPRVGGKLNFWAAPHPRRPDERPFRFDAGPTILTLPLIFQDLFAAAGEDVRDYLPIVRLDPIRRYLWADGTHLELRGNELERDREIARFAPRDSLGFRRLLRICESIWNHSAETLLFHAPERFSFFKRLISSWRISFPRSYARLIDCEIRDPRLRQVFQQYAIDRGVHPSQSPATLAINPFVEIYFGGWYIPGGIHRLADALEAVARKIGVEIRTSCRVDQILIEPLPGSPSGRTAGAVTSSGEIIRADAIVMNAPFSQQSTSRPAGGMFVLMLGVEGTYPHLLHHTRFMPDGSGANPLDPCLRVSAATRTDPSQAPPDCETLTISVSTPGPDAGIDWAIEGPRYRDRIVAALESKWSLTNLSRRIVVEQSITPADLASLNQPPAGLSPDILNLYFAGGSNHPGPGLPMAALSGKVAAERAIDAP